MRIYCPEAAKCLNMKYYKYLLRIILLFDAPVTSAIVHYNEAKSYHVISVKMCLSYFYL